IRDFHVTGVQTCALPIFQVFASVRQTQRRTCESLAEIEVSATGGTAPYEFATDLSGPWVAGTPTLVLPVDAGVYQYYARDINGCLSFVSNGVPITPVTPLQAGLGNSILYVTCNVFDNAIIRATATGGLGEYEFELYNGYPEANL